MSFAPDKEGPPDWAIDGLSPSTAELLDPEKVASFWPAAVDFDAMAEREPELPRFLVANWLPAGYATLMAGHGGVGKSGIALHLAVCMALGRPFFGLQVECRHITYLSCEDRENVLHWRLSRICSYEGVQISDLRGRLDLFDLVGQDTLLWHPMERNTHAYAALAYRMSPQSVLFVDGISDTFGGNENNKIDVKRYVNALISLIDPTDGALVLIGHVSKPTAAAPGQSEGYSGTTGWHNSVRARWYLYPESAYDADGNNEKTGDLVLDLQKSNLGASDQSLKFTWDAEAHMFVGYQPQEDSQFEKKHRSRIEREGIVECIRGSIAAGVKVPAASSGTRTAYHVLSARSDFPKSLRDANGSKRFHRIVMEMRHLGELTVETAVSDTYKKIGVLVPPNASGLA